MSDEDLIIKVYLDTCILSKLIAHTIEEEQLKSLDKICDYDYIDFVSSPTMLEEFQGTKHENTRIVLKVLYKLINKVPYTSLSGFEGGWSFPFKFPISFGTLIEDKLFSELKKIFPHKKDAEHIYQAAKSGCKYFMTLDENSILKKAKNFSSQLNIICPNLEFVDPKTLLDKLPKSYK